jgi:ADP-heptose:LPS heptosyltransferase
VDYPVKIIWIGKNPSLGLIKASFPFIETHDIKSFSLIDLNQIDAIIDLQGSVRSYLLCRKVGKPFFRIEKSSLSRICLVWQAYWRSRKQNRDEFQKTEFFHFQYEKMLAPLKKVSQLFWGKDLISHKSRPILQLVNYANLPLESSFFWIAIACGASSDTKKAPIAKIADIIKLTLEVIPTCPLGLILLGDLNDVEDSLNFLSFFDEKMPIVNLTGKKSLYENAVYIKQAKVILSNDSSLAHMAEALGTPSIVLFGPTIEEFGFLPWGEKSRAFSVPLGCRPCSKHGTRSCRFKDKLCFENINNKRVATYLAELISQSFAG